MYELKIVQCNDYIQYNACTSMCDDSDFYPPGCHFIYIFASKVSGKNKDRVSQIFGQSVTNDTSTLVWEPLLYSTVYSN